eukprot:CAMPEP_0206163542 /NCGR_PEP_ID=MMETSP1474-20131121/11479_1 /ASSEMBLY_ACC=CAM_ASM_001110 /TAXON_ID=97495 /ORGANISM="Imantonia sp., Strain RCC918" /LENGTH=54 /DNA_ID=CAMNT_0053566069 /DNA_START=247 /DNA_END=409 /DNA_ORIENTATION=-
MTLAAESNVPPDVKTQGALRLNSSLVLLLHAVVEVLRARPLDHVAVVVNVLRLL